MALLPKLGKENIEKTPCLKNEDDDDDFITLKKKPRTDDFKSLFKSSSLTNCTFNIQLSSFACVHIFNLLVFDCF